MTAGTTPGAPATTAPDTALAQWTTCGGCAAKWGAGPLRQLLAAVGAGAAARAPVPGLLVGLDRYDDAAVLQVAPDLAVVSTTDFFPPMVEDPGDFGSIAAANACSDVFAMGGRVVLALSLAAFPEDLDPAVIASVVSAAADTVAAAGGVVAGGHTIRSAEPIFGLAVQGLVHPERILTKGGARPGDVLVLSKPLGTGVVLQAGGPTERAAAVAGMRALNDEAARALTGCGDRVHAATDVTGYGLAGHGFEMAERSDAVLRFEAGALPLYPGAFDVAAAGARTGGDPRNRQALEGRVRCTAGEVFEALAYDPQTSGGLLAAVDPSAAAALVDAGFVAVGAVVPGDPAVEVA